jgi:hypothetical protein
MISRKKLKTSRYIAGLVVAVSVFLFGYMLSSQINSGKLKELSDMEQDFRTEGLSNELMFQLVQSNLCNNINLTSYNLEISKIGRRLTYMESIYGFNSSEVVRLKEYYALLEIRHWILSKEINVKCGYNIPLILYFYTNTGCADCEDQGFVLTNIYNDYPFINTYSFESTLNNAAVNYLKSIYNISNSRLPTLVIDDKIYYGFQSKDALIEILYLENLSKDKK